jgi:hypothetical protein
MLATPHFIKEKLWNISIMPIPLCCASNSTSRTIKEQPITVVENYHT